MEKIKRTFSPFLNLVPFGLFFLLFSCDSPVDADKNIVLSELQSQQQISTEKFITDSSLVIGELNKNVSCKNDPQISYALYVPATQNTNKKFPFILFFDSHAKGTLPVLKYRNLADKYGFIIAGSNNSKNGMTTESTTKIGRSIIEDMLTRLPIDSRRIYAGGFSGGARVAIALAETDSRVKAVIGCSAGLPQNRIKNKFDFFGIAGTHDMNYLEMLRTENSFSQIGMRHYLLFFEGKHEWAPESTMEDAFCWITLNAMKDNIIPKDEKIINDFKNKESKNLESKNIYTKWISLKKTIAFLSEISENKKELSILAELDASPALKKTNENIQTVLIKENSLQQAYLKSFQEKKPDWWQEEASRLRIKQNSNLPAYEKAMFDRVLGFLSLVSFSYVNNLMRDNNFAAAAQMNEIYKAVDPENPDVFYFEAGIAAAGENKNLALASLEKSVSLGFSDAERLNSDALFQNIKNEKTFLRLINKIKNPK